MKKTVREPVDGAVKRSAALRNRCGAEYICSACRNTKTRGVPEEGKAYSAVRIADNGLSDSVERAGTFCRNNCRHGVSVTPDKKLCSLPSETAKTFFREHIKGGVA